MREDTSEQAFIPYRSKKPVTLLSADGAYCSISSEQSSLSYYINMPYLKEKEDDDHAIEQLHKLLVEVWISTTALKQLIEKLLDSIEEESEEENKNTDQISLKVA